MNRSGSQIEVYDNNLGDHVLENSYRSEMSTPQLRDKSPNRTKIAQLAEKLNNTHINVKEQEMGLEKEAHVRLTQIDYDIDTIQKGTDRELENIKHESLEQLQMISGPTVLEEITAVLQAIF